MNGFKDSAGKLKRGLIYGLVLYSFNIVSIHLGKAGTKSYLQLYYLLFRPFIVKRAITLIEP